MAHSSQLVCAILFILWPMPIILLPSTDAPTAGSCASTGLTYPPKPGSGGGTPSSTSTAPVSTFY